uniref:SH3 domain-containing protein n=1 Tax=Lates calcarifer TaxID=8187 RepID=A0A4W6EJ00_LATCA
MHQSMELVSVQYEYEYTAKDGHHVSIKPNESYILVSKTNEHWWHVRKDLDTKPFYIPAQYVKEVQSHTGDSPGANNSKLLDITDVTPCRGTTVIRMTALDPSRETYRFSTFGLCENIPDVKPNKSEGVRKRLLAFLCGVWSLPTWVLSGYTGFHPHPRDMQVRVNW